MTLKLFNVVSISVLKLFFIWVSHLIHIIRFGWQWCIGYIHSFQQYTIRSPVPFTHSFTRINCCHSNIWYVTVIHNVFPMYIYIYICIWYMLGVYIGGCFLAMLILCYRLIAVRLPLKAKQFCTVQRASLVSSLILFLMLLRNLPVLWMRGEQILSGPENTTTVINCGYTSEEAYDYSTRINPLFSLIAVGLLPVGSATVINILIINELRKMHRFVWTSFYMT